MPADLDSDAMETARRAMVDCQVRPSNVTQPALIDAMLWAPRESFLPKAKRAQAYVGEHLPVGEGRFELDPMVFAKLVDAAQASSGDLAMVVGGGYGYAAAVLSKLVAAVVTLESDAAMAKAAAEALEREGVDTAIPVEGALTDGCASHAPYNLILINGASAIEPPQALIDQLAEGGRIAIIRMEGPVGRAMIGVKAGGVMGWRTVFDASAAVLPGFEETKGFEF